MEAGLRKCESDSVSLSLWIALYFFLSGVAGSPQLLQAQTKESRVMVFIRGLCDSLGLLGKVCIVTLCVSLWFLVPICKNVLFGSAVRPSVLLKDGDG